MMISEVEPDLRQIIRTLRDGNLETRKAKIFMRHESSI